EQFHGLRSETPVGNEAMAFLEAAYRADERLLVEISGRRSSGFREVAEQAKQARETRNTGILISRIDILTDLGQLLTVIPTREVQVTSEGCFGALVPRERRVDFL